MSDLIDTCPSCQADLSEASGAQWTGIVINDRLVCWECPFCAHQLPREARPPVTGFRDCNIKVFRK